MTAIPPNIFIVAGYKTKLVGSFLQFEPKQITTAKITTKTIERKIRSLNVGKFFNKMIR